MNGGCAMGRATLSTSEQRLHENCLDVHGGLAQGDGERQRVISFMFGLKDP